MVRFDDNGQLCADNSFQKHAGLLSPPGFSEDIACFDLKTAWPQTELNLDPETGRVDLVLPFQAVARPGAESGNWNHGGVAGLFNYEAQYMDSAGTTSGVNFMQLGSEAGININDWIIRSRHTFSRFNGVDTVQHQGAYAQRSFIGSKQVLQAGQIQLSNSMFGTGQVLGFQMFPEVALQGSRGGPGLVEGTADSQSVVEIRQSGVLVHSTTVPAGPFRLQGFSLLNTRSDL
ncbi:putative outer membrane usher protein YhcD [Pseudomonas synxantha]|uniref:Putative outer membrane usher protein YhcD n=1 Tax=Pseudomonas synxantha TaxID=47883 RepID=A0A3G7UED3_9PSED|nr:putative outer membrane usher protein YhcD [Pseudomonas synxantha]